jgi:hypothetical protein
MRKRTIARVARTQTLKLAIEALSLLTVLKKGDIIEGDRTSKGQGSGKNSKEYCNGKGSHEEKIIDDQAVWRCWAPGSKKDCRVGVGDRWNQRKPTCLGPLIETEYNEVRHKTETKDVDATIAAVGIY